MVSPDASAKNMQSLGASSKTDPMVVILCAANEMSEFCRGVSDDLHNNKNKKQSVHTLSASGMQIGGKANK